MRTETTRRAFLAAIGGSAVSLTVGNRVWGDTPAKLTGFVNGQLQAAEAGNAVLAAGGNAVDAIVSAALVAGVVAIPLTGIGGYGGHIIISRPDGKVSAIDFNTVAPANVTPDIYKADEKGNVKDDVNAFGWKAVGVPGVLAGLQLALDKFGSKPLAELLKPAIRFAKDGFPITKPFATQTKGALVRLAKDPGSAKLLLKDGQPPAEGAILKNPDLGVMLQTLADRGSVATFYKGDIADQLATAFRKNDGWVTAADLAAYKALEVEPLSVEWNGFKIHTPPPSSGGLTVLQSLTALKALEWPGEENEVARSRIYLEALRVSWTDRLQYLGDPVQADVPVKRLLSEDHARQTAKRVRAALAAGKPVEGQSDGRPSGGTIHLNAIDATGLTAAVTFTHGGYFGAQVTVDGLGLVLGQGLSRFDPRPGRANSPGAGKRPLHNMCPTIVTRDGSPVLAVGATGGRKIVNAVTRAVAGYVGEKLSTPDAVAALRIHTEGDMKATLDPKHPATEEFKKAGYQLTEGTVAALTALGRDPETKQLRPAAR
ncbi:gamma-glutamyltransferase family protein [Zavarzinella formosa]|uniref:gamma-glutamyltransferase family protein n=1 Tax=Zavarzinella formosa TaxID=360055 RepID=UPI0002F7215C|nr:gamma-glutamyltransferase [Zavarzinella formosa]